MARNRRKGQAPLAAIAANALRRQQKLLRQRQEQLESEPGFTGEAPLTPPPSEMSSQVCTESKEKRTTEYASIKRRRYFSPTPSDVSSSEDSTPSRYLPLSGSVLPRKQRGLKTSRPIKVSKATRGCVIQLGWHRHSPPSPNFLLQQHQQEQVLQQCSNDEQIFSNAWGMMMRVKSWPEAQ